MIEKTPAENGPDTAAATLAPEPPEEPKFEEIDIGGSSQSTNDTGDPPPTGDGG